MAGVAPRPQPRSGLGRAALFAFGTTAAIAPAACSDDDSSGNDAHRDAGGGAHHDAGDAHQDAGGDTHQVAGRDAAAQTHLDASSGTRDASVGDASDARAREPVTPDDSDDLGGLVPVYALAAPPGGFGAKRDAGPRPPS